MRVSDLVIEHNKAPTVSNINEDDVNIVAYTVVSLLAMGIFIVNIFYFLNSYLVYTSSILFLCLLGMIVKDSLFPKEKQKHPIDVNKELVQQALNNFPRDGGTYAVGFFTEIVSADDVDDVIDRIITNVKIQHNKKLEYDFVRSELKSIIINNKFGSLTNVLDKFNLIKPNNLIISVGEFYFYDTAKQLLQFGIKPEKIIKGHYGGMTSIFLNKEDMHLYDLAIKLDDTTRNRLQNANAGPYNGSNGIYLKTDEVIELVNQFNNKEMIVLPKQNDPHYSLNISAQPTILTGTITTSNSNNTISLGNYISTGNGQIIHVGNLQRFQTLKKIAKRIVLAYKKVLKLS